MLHTSEFDDVDVERLRFPWKTMVAIVCAIVTIVSAFKAAEIAAGKELAEVRTRLSVTETKQQHTDHQLDRLQQTIDRLEGKVDRLLERGR